MTKDSDMKMTGEKSLEIQVKTLEKGMGTLIRAFKELKENVKALEDKVENKYNEEVMEMKENQKKLEDLLRENSEAIKKIDNVLKRMEDESSKDEVEEINKSNINSGHCKYKSGCRFSHPIETCKNYLEEGKCDRKQCTERHPKICKWWQGKRGCKRDDCDYLHDTLACDDGQLKTAHKEFPCAGCKSVFQDSSCVVHHKVNDVGFNLCLNCEGWIKHKEMVLMSGWTIFDQNGYLRTDV